MHNENEIVGFIKGYQSQQKFNFMRLNVIRHRMHYGHRTGSSLAQFYR